MNTELQLEPNNKSNFKNILMDFLKGNKKPKMNANKAYLQSKYHVIETDEERLKQFKDNIDILISAKCHVGDYCCAVQVEDDMLKFLENTIKEYTELGYVVLHIDKTTAEIKNNYLFLCWDCKC